MGSEIWKPNNLKTGHFDKNHLKSVEKCLAFKWTGFQKVGTITIAIVVQPFKTGLFEIQSSKSLDFECFLILNGLISDFHSTAGFE